MIAALFVAKGGVYYGLPGVDPWDAERDAREYAGPWPVVAHPPCERWGRYWSGGPSARVKRTKGDDGGCFTAALAAVRAYGGVLEHPEASHAFEAHGLTRPPYRGGWVPAVFGWTCCVPQGNYGHPARKLTWLYACVPGAHNLPDLRWEHPKGLTRLDSGFHSQGERAEAGGSRARRLTPRENAATPVAFRDMLLELARTVGTTGRVAT
jgi:hypothetical protein